MTATTAEATAPKPPALQDEAVLTPDAVRTSPDPAITEVEARDEKGSEHDTDESLSDANTQNVDRDDDDQKESAPEPYDIEKCTLTFRIEIFPREANSAPRLTLLAMNSHGDEPFKPRLVAFDGDFAALVSHMNGLYAELAAAMPERAAAAARRTAEAKARKEAEEAERKARLAKAQNKGKRQRGSRGQTNLLAVPDDGQTAAAPSPRSGREPAGARRSAPGTVAPASESSPKPIQPPAPVEDPLQGAEPENQEDKKQFSLFL
jgi:hypothetical protein